jgi:hypothetical protein
MSKRVVHTVGTVRVHYDSDLQEYRVSQRGKSDEGYFTSDKQDAIDTADAMNKQLRGDTEDRSENPRERVFQYASELRRRNSSIEGWTWTRSGGLRVKYSDGTQSKSEYTLPELLDGREGQILELIDGEWEIANRGKY